MELTERGRLVKSGESLAGISVSKHVARSDRTRSRSDARLIFENFELDVGVTCVKAEIASPTHWDSCIRECFVGNYRVNNDSGSHFLSQVKGGRQLPLLLFALTAKVQN
jgi:hypothetical protein